MSNSDINPDETRCSAGTPVPGTIELIDPRDVPLGGLRAMNVRRTLPQRARSLIGAWCFLDHYGPDEVMQSGGMNVPAHPHTGLQTASWLFSGEIEHRDSAGFHAIVRPGELNLMTAGRGISHSERSTPETTTLHGAQLWIALPEHARHGAKTFEHYAPSPLLGHGWRASVFLGSVLGQSSPVTTFTPLLGAEISLDAGTTLEIELDPGFEHGVLVDTGTVTLATSTTNNEGDARDLDSRGTAKTVNPSQLAYLSPASNSLRLTAGDADARVLLLGGEPFPEQIVMWWNFIGRDHDEIMQARADWQMEIAAAGVADVSTEGLSRAASRNGVSDPTAVFESTPDEDHHRFGLPDAEPDPPLPAPAAPLAKLKPRSR